MKRLYLFLMVLVAFIAASCVEESIVKSASDEVIITGGFDQDTRTVFVEGDGVIKTHWVEGDEIGIYSKEGEHSFLASNVRHRAISGGKSTTFEKTDEYDWMVTFDEGKTFYAYYPFQQNGYVSTTFIATNYYRHDGNIVPFLYSKAQVKDGKLNFRFKHLFAYLKIVVSAEDVRKHFAECQSRYDQPYFGNYIKIDGAYISISSPGIVMGPGSEFDLETQEITLGYTSNEVVLECIDGMDLESNDTYSFMVPISPLSEDSELAASFVFRMDGVSSDFSSDKYFKSAPKGGFQPGHVYVWNIVNNTKHEDNVRLLQSLYDKTDGGSWHRSDNWFSDKALFEWYGINQSLSKDITSVTLGNNNLTGQFPEEVADLMDHIVVSTYYNDPQLAYDAAFDLSRNNLYGRIPDVVKNHKRWPELGWQCVIQNTFNENELDLTDSGLYVENVRVEDLFEDKATVQYLYDIFKENELTQITGCDCSDYDVTHIDDVLENFIDSRVNLHLDYHEKGLHTVFFLGNLGTEEEENELKQALQGIYGEVDGVTWVKGKNNNFTQYSSASYFYDSDGQLVYAIEHNPTCVNSDEQFLVSKCDKFLSKRLGVPDQRHDFTADLYESQDYSRDGEVMTLQRAIIGHGIDLVFMGEAFVDKDMAPGGFYEQTMIEAMEQFFSFEPYKSMRERFNVYAVKVVSKNSVFMEGAEHAINENPKVCFEYAKPITEASSNPPMISVIYRDFTWGVSTFGRSYCQSYEDGSFVSFIVERLGNDGSVLMHETGGHGFAGLLDEYVERGYEDQTLSDLAKEGLDYRWALYGRGANVDWRSDRKTVKWAHFLEDERYADENLDLYEGAWNYGHGIYRPSENSMMRYNDGPFNAPSREQIYKLIMQRSEGADWEYNYEDFVTFDKQTSAPDTRSAGKSMSEQEKREYIRNHQPPIFVKGGWRDAMNEKR